MLAQVEPGELRDAAPRRAARARRAVRGRARATSTRLLLPAVTHWQSPRFFAYFAHDRLRAGHPRRAARRRAEPGRDPLAHVAGAAGARGADARLARAAARAAGRPARPPRGHRLDRDDGGARGGAAGEAGRARRRLLRARALLGREGVPAARARGAHRPGRRRVPAAAGRARPRGRLRGRGHDRDDVDELGRPGAGDRGRVRARGRLAARRRRLRRLGRRLPGAARRLRRLGARRLGRRQPAQVAASRRWTARRCGRAARTSSARAFSLVPEYLRVSEEVASLSEYSPALGRRSGRSSSGRCCAATAARAAGADPRGDPARGALRGLGARRAGLGGGRAAAVLARLLPARRRRTRRTRRCSSGSTRAARSSSRTRSWTAATSLRLAVGNARTTEDDVRLAWERAQAGSGSASRREAVEQLLEQLAVALDADALGLPVDDEVVEADRVALDEDVGVLGDPRGRRRRRRARPPPSPTRNAIVPRGESGERARSSASISQPVLERVGRRRAHQAGAEAGELVQHRAQVAPGGVSS